MRSAVSICLHSSFPTAIYWGPELRLLYNDAWAPIPAERHPWALGQPGATVWADIWHIVGPQFARVLRTGEGFSTYDQMLPMVRGGAIRETYWNYSFTAIRGEDGSVVGVFNQGHETTAAVLSRRKADAEIERLGRMFEQAPGAIAILRGPHHEFEFANTSYETLVGRGDLVGKTVADALPEVIAQGFVSLLDQAFATGKPYVGRATPVSLQRSAIKPAEVRLVDFVFQPVFDGAGECSGIFVQATDVTEQGRAEQARQLLLHEMNHRVKNLFAIASGMVSMTARTASSIADMERALRGRLSALAQAHELVRAGFDVEAPRPQQASLRALLEAITAPHLENVGEESVVLDGPDLALGANAVTSLALIFHELATNAAKYGALSSPGGHLSIHWLDKGGNLHIQWTERVAGKSVAPPSSVGFGSKLARNSAAVQLGGVVDFDWQPDGVRVFLTIPINRLQA